MASSSDIEETLREASQQLPEQYITGQEPSSHTGEEF